MRNLIDIIDEIVAIAPDLEGHFKSLRSSTLYSAPELLPERWNSAADILNSIAINHPEKDKIAKIFSGAPAIK